MIRIERYTPSYKTQWDSFVDRSKNGTFLLRREYMDYHADRFTDHSLIFRNDKGDIETLLPATQCGSTLSSHGGLTYGGFIMTPRTAAPDPLRWMEALHEYGQQHGIASLIYKPIPHIYHRLPAEEDLYALFRNNARIEVRNLASVVQIPDAIASRLGKRAAKRTSRYGITVEQTDRIGDFWQIIVDDRRERHNTTPVHTLDEMQLLADRFPGNIMLFKAMREGRVIAGAVIFVNRPDGVIHLQYAAGNHEGMETYAVDAIYHHVIFNVLPQAAYFDFGTSNENKGLYLNTGMTAHKEEFGARSIIYDTYRIDL